MKLNKNQLSVVKSIIKEEIEKFKSLKEGSWQVITNDEGEPIGKDYVYGPEDPEYYETGDDYNDDRPRSRVGSSVGEKSDVINSIRDILKRNDIYSKIVMSSGRSGRYISIPYNDNNLAIRFVFKRGEGMKIEVGSRLFTDAYEAVDYLLKNSDKNMFKSQSEHESSLKAGAKDRRAQNVKDKEAKKAEQEKLEKLEKIKRIPAIASAIGEHGLYNKRDFKVLFGNTPSKVISATIQDILETMPYDELRKIVKITVDKPKYFSENKKTTKKQITISELRQIIKESIESFDDKAISEGGKDGIKEGDYILVHQDPYEVVSGEYMERVPDGNPYDGFSPEWHYKIKDADGKIWKMKAGQLRKGLKKYLSKEEFESISAERKEEKIRRSAQLDAELKAQSQARIDAERKAQIDAGNKYKSLPLVPNDIKEEFYFDFEENVYDFGIEDLGRDDLVMEVFSSSFETENDYVQLKAVVTLDTELGHDTSFDRNTGKVNWLEIGYSNEKIVKLTFVDANTGEDKYRLDDELTKMVEGDIYECLDYLEEDFRKQAKGWSASY